MNLEKKNNINYTLLTNLVFSFFPISFILGNLIINLNLLLFCCLGIFHLKSRILKIKFDFVTKIILLFFFIVFFSTALSFLKFLYIDGYEYNNLSRLIKSIAFFRFFLMLIIVYLLTEFGVLNFKYFFISAAFFPILVSIDVIFQYFFSFDLIGLEGFHIEAVPIGRYNAGFFGDELIAGGYIKNFSFFSILFLAFKFKNKNYTRFIFTLLAICVLGLGILVSGNRMPLLLFLLGLLLVFLFNVNLKKIIPVSIISLFIIFYFIASTDQYRKHQFIDLFGNMKQVLIALNKELIHKQKYIIGFETEDEKLKIKGNNIIADDFEFFWVINTGREGYIALYLTAIDLWKENKIFGNGIKSFRKDCIKLFVHKKYRMCSNHPHNYYLEILVESGIVGLLCAGTLALIFLIFIFKNFKFIRGSNIENFILSASIISLIIEVFPFRNTGSIFTTANATYIIIISSIALSYSRQLKNQNF